MYYLEKLEKLYLSDETLVDSKTFFEVSKQNKEVKEAIAYLVTEKILEEVVEENKYLYKIAPKGYELLQESEHWERIQEEKAFLEKKNKRRILRFLENIYLENEEFVDGKSLLGVEKIGKEERADIEQLLMKNLIKETPEEGKKNLYGLTDIAWKWLKEDTTLWTILEKKKEKKERDMLYSFLQIIQDNANKTLSASIRKEYGYLIEKQMELGNIEMPQEQKYLLTKKGEYTLFTLSPPKEILESLIHSFASLKGGLEKAQFVCDTYAKNIEDNELAQDIFQAFSHMNENAKNTIYQLEMVQTQIEQSAASISLKIYFTNEIDKLKEHFYERTIVVKKSIEEKQRQFIAQIRDIQKKEKEELEQSQQKLRDSVDTLQILHTEVRNALGEIASANEIVEEPKEGKSDHKKEVVTQKTAKKKHVSPKEKDQKTEHKIIEKESPLEVENEEKYSETKDEQSPSNIIEYEEEVVEPSFESTYSLSTDILQELRDYYSRTYYQHHGVLNLQVILDYLEASFQFPRNEIKNQILMYNDQGKVILVETIDFENFSEDDIIRDFRKSYFALKIPDLMEF